MATAEALAWYRASTPDRRSWKAHDDLVRWAAQVVDSTGIVEAVAEWRAAACGGPGGRPETFPLRSLLVAMVIAVRMGHPLLVTTFTDILFKNISPLMRAKLGVPDPPADDDVRGQKACYRNARTRLHGFLDLIDPSPLPKNRRLRPKEFEAATRELSPEEIEIRYERLEWVANQLIEASIRLLPEEIRQRWKGTTSLDATPIPLYARPPRRRGRGSKARTVTHSTDPDGGWYVRHEDRDESLDIFPTEGKSKYAWAMEASVCIATFDDPLGDRDYPLFVTGMSVLHRPGERTGQNGVRALASATSRGHPASWLAVDRAYTGAKPEHFQLPARALGYEPILDYRIDQLGLQGSYGGSLLIEGNWYCPSIPEPLINATIDRRAGRIDEEVFQQRIRARAAYMLQPKQRPDDEGHQRMLCPAAGLAPSVRCELKPKSVSHRTAGRTRVLVNAEVKADPPKICRQQSITIPPEEGAKYFQRLQYKSQEWTTRYRSYRNTIEGANGVVKDSAFEGLRAPENRRIRGVAAQTLFTALCLFAMNLRKMDSMYRACVAERQKMERRKRTRQRRRSTDPISKHRPKKTRRGPDPPT